LRYWLGICFKGPIFDLTPPDTKPKIYFMNQIIAVNIVGVLADTLLETPRHQAEALLDQSANPVRITC